MTVQTVSNTVAGTIMAGATAPKVAAGPKDVKLEKTCQEFESVFLSMIWKEMQKSTGTDLGGWDTFAEQAMGQHWAKSGGIGLAKVIYRQMAKHL